MSAPCLYCGFPTSWPGGHPSCLWRRDQEAEAIERAYWVFDARRSGTFKRDTAGVLGPQEERDAFKAAVRSMLVELEKKP